LSVVAFAVIDVMCTAGPDGLVVAESGVADVESPAVVFDVSPAAAADTLLTVIVLVASSAVAVIVVVPIVVPPVRTPEVETSTTPCDAVAHPTVTLRTTLPWASFTTAVACACCPGASDESGAEISILVPRCPPRWSLAVSPSAERGSRGPEDSQDMRRNPWSPTSTGAMIRYERWGRRIERGNLSKWRRTRRTTHHSEGSDARMSVVSWVGARRGGAVVARER
jgi:hypothetical protein